MPTAAPVAPGVPRARHSQEYVDAILRAQARLKQAKGRTAPTPQERQARLQAILSDKDNYMRRIGTGLIGPIQLKLRYQGMVRNILLEDPLTPGVPIEYDVLDQLGKAYVLHGNEGEVQVTPFEGKRVPVRLFRIATFPQVKKEDLWYLRVNIVDYAQDESKQSIMKQEDARLITLIDEAIDDYGATVAGGPLVLNELSGRLTPDSLYDLVGSINGRELNARRLLMHPTDHRDLYKWDMNETGMAFKDDLVAGEEVQHFGEFQVNRSIMVPPGTVYLAPEPEFLGVFPVMYSLDVEENNTVEKFHKGWVIDELVSMIILNPRGLGKIVKS